MPYSPITAVIAGLVFALATAPSAMAQARSDTPRGTTATSKHDRKQVASRPGAMKIACPKGGCRLIPANCKVTMEETWEGPTGNELIACP